MMHYRGISKTVVFSHNGSLSDYVEQCERDPLWRIIRQEIPEGSRILEAGAGSGRWLAFLHRKGYDVVGIELNRASVDVFRREYPQIEYDTGDVCSLPFPDGSFDAVLSLGVLEHFVDGPDEALKETRRVLRNEGTAIVSVPLANGIWKIEKLKDRLTYPVLASGTVRKVLGKAPATFDPVAQTEYLIELKRHLLRGLDYKCKFDPYEGRTFYEYRYRVDQLLDVLKPFGFSPTQVYLEYADQRLYQVFGGLVGEYAPGKGVALNWFGECIRKLFAQRSIAHMVVCVSRKTII